MGRKPEHIYIPQPPMGCKIYLIERPGMFVLERGPGTIITNACTHAGAGSLLMTDGIPDDNGYFPDVPERPAGAALGSPEFVAWAEAFGKRNGRHFYRANPVVMGSWMLNAGFHHGLTIEVSGGHNDMSPMASIVWQPFRGVARSA